MKNATIAILADKIYLAALSVGKKIYPSASSVADESAPQHMKVLRTHRAPHRVGFSRLPRTEAGIYPPPYPADNQPC